MLLTPDETLLLGFLQSNPETKKELLAQAKKEKEEQERKDRLAAFTQTINESSTLGDFTRALGSVHKDYIKEFNSLKLLDLAQAIIALKAPSQLIETTKPVIPLTMQILYLLEERSLDAKEILNRVTFKVGNKTSHKGQIYAALNRLERKWLIHRVKYIEEEYKPHNKKNCWYFWVIG